MADNDVRVRLSLDSQGMNGGLSSAISSLTSLKGQLGAVAQVAAKTAKAFVKFGKDSVKWFGNVLKSAVKMGVGIAGAFAGFASVSVKAAADAKALDEMFSSTFGDMADDATKAMEKISKETGIHAGRLKEPFTKAFMQIKGSGTDAAEALKMTQKATRLAADAAAAYNIPMEEANSKILSFMRGNVEAGDAIGLFTSEMQRNEKATKKYGKAWKDLSEAQKQSLMLDISEELYRQSGALGQALKEAEGLENIMGNFKYVMQDILKVMGNKFLESAIQEIKDFTIVINDVTGLLEQNKFGEAFDLVTTYISDKVKEFAKNIPELMSRAIDEIGNAITNSLPKMLSAGGQLIQNIGKGIVENKNSIQTAISNLLGQVSTWITQNMPAIAEAGKSIIEAIKNGIDENREIIGEAINIIAETAVSLFLEYKAVMFETGLELGWQFIKGVWEGIWKKGQEYKPINDNYYIPPQEATESGKKTGEAYGDGVKQGVNSKKEDVKNASKQVSTETVDQMLAGLEALEPGTHKKMLDAAQAVRQSATDMYNGAKYSFSQLGLAAKESMSDMYNGVKTSMSKLAQIVKQEATNMYNGAKTSFVNLCNVGKNQFSNLYNGAGNSIRQLSYTVQGCMNSIKSAIDSIGSAVDGAIGDYNRLRNALSKPIKASVSINQTRTISTVNAEPQAAMAMATSTLAMPKSPVSLGSGPLSKGQGGVIENNIYLDGKLIAKTTAPYADKEITKINNRMNRLGGRI